MKNPALKFIIALLILAIFSSGISLTIFPGQIKESSLVSLQKQESENDSSRNENVKDPEIKEFIGEMVPINLSLMPPVLLKSQNRVADFSILSKFYLKVPTPPPDYI